MLTPADAGLCRRDTALPGLAAVLDPDVLVSKLEPHLRGREGEILSARPTYVRYKPGTNCLVSYRMRVAGASEEIRLYAKVYGADAPAKLEKARERPGVPGPLGPGRVALPDFGGVVSFFPNDDKLRTLSQLSGPESRRSFFEELLPGRPELWDGELRTLRYKPERRYVARLSNGGLSEATSEGHLDERLDAQAHAQLKVYTKSRYRAARKGAEAFTQAFKTTGPFRLVPLLGRSDRHSALAFEWVPGRPLDEVILDPALEISEARNIGSVVGAALAELHGQSPRGLGHKPRGEEATVLRRAAEGVESVAPHLASLARELARDLADYLLQTPPNGTPIHGDFDAGQVLLASDSIVLLDLDRAVKGDPAEDIGTFVAQLERGIICGELPSAKAQAIEESLLDGYRGSSLRAEGGRIVERVGFYIAAGLLKLAPEPFRYRAVRWTEETEKLLQRAREVLKPVSARISGV